MNPGTDPSGLPDASTTLKDPETLSTSQGSADALTKNAELSDTSHDDAADAAAQAAATRSGGGGAGQSGVDGLGYWQVAWLYLTSLLKLGEVYETAGNHEDAAHAFKEGLQLVCHFLSSIQFLQSKHASRPAAHSNMGHVRCILCT